MGKCRLPIADCRIREGTHGELAARRGRTRPTFADFADFLSGILSGIAPRRSDDGCVRKFSFGAGSIPSAASRIE